MLKKSILLGILLAAAGAAATDTRVADAAEQGDRAAVRSLISEKADVNGAQGDGTTALHWAAYNDDLEIAKTLVAAGASVKATTRDAFETPLFMACRNGSVAMLDLLIKAGSDVNASDEHATTPLMLAAEAGDPAAVKLLLDHGASPNAREGQRGQTALMFAADMNRAAAIKVLLDHGASPNLLSRSQKLPKSLQMRNDDGTPIVENKDGKDGTEEKAGGEKDEKTAADKKPAADKTTREQTAAKADQPKAPEPNAELKEMIAKLSAKVDAIEKRLQPPAGEDGKEGKENSDDGRMFRKRGTLDFGGMSALLYAARDGQIDAAKALVAGKADIDEATTLEKITPLVMATMNGHFDLAMYLVSAGAKPNLANSYGLTPLFAAIDIQWAPKGWSPSASVAHEKTTYLELMEALLKAGAEPDARLGSRLWYRSSGDHSWVDPAGATAFWRAAQSSDVNAMRLLVNHGADPSIPSKNGTTPLMVASGIGWGYHYSMNLPDSWMAAVRYCVQLGADVTAAADTGYTALHGAAYLGNHEMIQYLLDHGADIKAVAKDKNTVADMANGPTRFGIPHPETVALLEKLGSANSHNCRSDQCLVAPKEDKKPAAAPAAGKPETTETTSSTKKGGQ